MMASFGLFYTISTPLVNLLGRMDLPSVIEGVQEQLTLTVSALANVVASVVIYSYSRDDMSGMTSASLSVDIHRTFSGQIQSYYQCCERIADSMWRHQLLRENLEGDHGMSGKRPVWETPLDQLND
jgi:hypothetical protein